MPGSELKRLQRREGKRCGAYKSGDGGFKLNDSGVFLSEQLNEPIMPGIVLTTGSSSSSTATSCTRDRSRQ